MKRFFSAAQPVDSGTLNTLIQPRHALIDKKNQELIDFLNNQQDQIIAAPSTDKLIGERLDDKFPLIRATVSYFVKDVLDQSDVTGNEHGENINFAARSLGCLDTPANTSITDRLKLRFSHLKNLIAKGAVAAKEQTTLDAIAAIQNGASTDRIGFKSGK